MGSAMRTLWDDSPAVTRLACAAYPTLSVATLVVAPLVPSARAAFLCCLHTVFSRRYVWTLCLSMLYRPIQHLLSIFMILVEVYLGLAYLPERERDLGSCRFLGWVVATTGAVNLVFLMETLFLSLLVDSDYQLHCNQGLLALLVVCITLRALAGPREPVSVFGLVYVPSRWYPVVLATVLSVLSGGILWDVAAALAVGYAQASLRAESFLPSSARAASLERRCLCGSFRLLVGRLGSWVPVHSARGYEDLEGASHRYATLSEVRSVSAQRLGSSASGDGPLFRGPAIVRCATSPSVVSDLSGPAAAADAAGGPAESSDPMDRQQSMDRQHSC